jgi:hypothetical protein
MDLVGYDRAHFEHRGRIPGFLAHRRESVAFIPVAGRDGDNIATFESPVVAHRSDSPRGAGCIPGGPRRTGPSVCRSRTSTSSRIGATTGAWSPARGIRTARAGTRSSSTHRGNDRESTLKRSTTRPAGISAGEAAGFHAQNRSRRSGELAALSHERRPEISSRLRVGLALARPQHSHQEEGLSAQARFFASLGAPRRSSPRHRRLEPGVDRRRTGSSGTKSPVHLVSQRAIAFDLADTVARPAMCH